MTEALPVRDEAGSVPWEQRATSALLAGIGAFQACLAVGAPWGAAAYGGGNEGRLPDRLRLTSGVASVVYWGLAGVVASGRGSRRVRSGLFAGVAGLMTVATVMNAASRSLPERLIWTPTAAVTAVLAWRSRPRSHTSRRRTGGGSGSST